MCLKRLGSGSDLNLRLLEMSARALRTRRSQRVTSKQRGSLNRLSDSKVAFALGCVRVPDASPVRVFEYCVKDFKRLLNAFNLFTIFERFVSFRQLARLTRQLTLVEFVKLKRFTPYLKLPTL